MNSTGKALVLGSIGKVTYTFFRNPACIIPIPTPIYPGVYYCKADVAADTLYAGATSAVATITITPKVLPESDITLLGISNNHRGADNAGSDHCDQ